MRVIAAADLERSSNLYNDIAATLSHGGLACFPAESSYRLAADLLSSEAVTRLMQTKRRAGHHPALVFVADATMLGQVVREVPPIAQRLIAAFWPGPLTLLLDVNGALPPKVAKTLTRATGKVGVRAPSDPIAARVVREFGGPLLVSSANLERKAGAGSVAQVRKNFQRVDVCVDAGDLTARAPSTLVDVGDGTWTVAREGAIPRARIEEVLVTGAGS